MKKILCLILTLLMLCTLFGCKKKPEHHDEPTQKNDATSAGQSEDSEIPENTKSDNQQSIEDNQDVSPDTKSPLAADDVQTQTQPEQTIENQTEQIENAVSSEKNEHQLTESEPDGDIIVVSPVDPFAATDKNASDIFIGKILEKKIVDDVYEFPIFMGFEKGAAIYKIQIEHVYRGTCVSNGDIVYLYKELYVSPNVPAVNYEIGEKYLLSAAVQPHNGEPVLVNVGFICAKIESDKTLTPLTSTSETALKEIDTLEKFNNSEKVKEFCMSEFKNFSSTFTKYIKTDKTDADLIMTLKKQ